ncbi:MAG TPA: hypothetical protein PLO51_04015, partial [Candidatus Micrarchaeota archaeon]|nr:hypothetical protein [Candidatus Micrarchaeota archaeon]
SKRANPKCVIYIVPPFNPAVGGNALNRGGAGFMGPVFKNGIFKLSEAEIITLEGTGLGTLFEPQRENSG